MLLYLLIVWKLIANLCLLAVFPQEEVWHENKSSGRVPKGGESNRKGLCILRELFIYFCNDIFPEQSAEETTNETNIQIEPSGDWGMMTINNKIKTFTN